MILDQTDEPAANLSLTPRDGTAQSPPGTNSTIRLATPAAGTINLSTPTTTALTIPAAAAATTVTLLNGATVNLNTDGSTSVLGARGNAIENINSTGVTILAAPSSTPNKVTVPIWYAPADEANYFQNILNYPGIFSTVAGGIAVFKMYGELTAMPDATLKAFFAFLTQNNIKLAIEAGPLVAGPGQPGYGIESFAGPGDLVAMLTRLQYLGAPVSTIDWDEPLWYGNISTGILTVSQLATQVALSSADAKALFPNVQIGDIEPVGEPTINSTLLQNWFTAYAAAAPTPFTSFQADVSTWSAGWETSLASVITTAHADNMTVGVIVNGIDAPPNNDSWATQADANAQLILSDPVLRPDFVIVQSWQSYPSEVGDPTIAGTLASVAADVAASEPAAVSVSAVAQYSTAGLLQNVTWTGGATASHTGSDFQVLSATGAVIFQTAWSNVQNFAFDPNTATASLTDQVLTSAIGATPVWTSKTSSIGLGGNGIAITAPVASTSSLTVALAAASQTGYAGSGLTNLTMPTLTGIAPDNAVVAINVDGVTAGNATASSTGSWSFTLPAALTTGSHVVQASVTNSTTGVTTQQEYVVSVDTATPIASTLVLADGSDSGYPGDDITDVTQPIFQGVADPSTQVSLTLDGKLLGTVETDLTGKWSYAVNTALTLGTHTITATAINPAGTAAAPASLQVTIDTVAAEAAVINYDPLFDTAYYLLNSPAVAAAGVNPDAQFNTSGWMSLASPSPYFSTAYYINAYPDVLAAQISPLLQFENAGWQAGRNPSPTENTLSLGQSLNVPAGQDPIITYIQTFEYSDAIYTAVPNSTLAIALLHDTGSSSTDKVTNDPTLAITADPGATVTVALGSATPSTLTLGSTGSWSCAYAAASLADGTYTATVTETPLGSTTSTVATLSYTLDRTAPTVTAVTATRSGSGTLGAGNVVTITLTFTEAVQVKGLPTLTLNDTGVAQYTSGSGTKALTFTYTVAAGQTTSALAVTAVALPAGASILDTAGNLANLAGADVALAGPVVVGTQLSSAGPNVTLASGAGVTANQTINGYNVALQGASAATASTINVTSAVLGSAFGVTVTGAGSAAQHGGIVANGSNENDGTIIARKSSAGGSATLAISISNAPGSAGTTTVPGIWNNVGTIDAEPGGTIDITGSAGADLINAGSLISNGMMFLATPVSGTGTMTVGSASGTSGTLEIQGGVAAGQSIVMNAGTLTIDSLGSFLATVTNFNSKDSIELKGLNASKVDWGNGVLSIDGGQAGSIRLQPAANLDANTADVMLGHVNGNTILTIAAFSTVLH